MCRFRKWRSGGISKSIFRFAKREISLKGDQDVKYYFITGDLFMVKDVKINQAKLQLEKK